MKRIYGTVLVAAAFVGGIATGSWLEPFESEERKPGATVGSPSQQPASADSETADIGRYVVNSSQRSHFARGQNGELIREGPDDRPFFKVEEGQYSYKRTLVSNRTALIVMDPWEDSGSPFLQKHFEPIYRQKVLPVISKAVELQMAVLVLTNDPERNPTGYGDLVFSELRAMAETEEGVRVLYHQDFDDESFAEYLRSLSIDTLIYSGFSSNQCVIGRSMGMIPMLAHGFKLFFIPEASAAVEFESTWKTGAVHQATTEIISQWIGELITWDDFVSIPAGVAAS